MSLTLPRFGDARPARFVSSTIGVFIALPLRSFFRVFEDTDTRDAVLPEPQHGEQQVLEADLVAFRRQAPEKPENEPADGLELVLRELQPQLIVQLADVGLPFDDVPVRGNFIDLPKLLLLFVPDIPDDLLDEVLHGDEAIDPSV